MDQVWEEDCILDEEDGDVVSDDIWLCVRWSLETDHIERTEISLVCIEARREPVNVARCVCTSTAAGDGGEADEHWCFFILGGEE